MCHLLQPGFSLMACVRRWRGSWVVDYRDAEGTRKIITVGSKLEGNESWLKLFAA